ncbi:uncharacterized protein [Apostichopus japonicus]|uniref:uncharacterized protein isoform X1 n=1 Tax=Stichopus japonicus TaxID=307972 RepID=UPI003AB12CAE
MTDAMCDCESDSSSSSSDSEDEAKHILTGLHKTSECSADPQKNTLPHDSEDVTSPQFSSRLPFVVLLVMKLVCIFQHSQVTGVRRCFRCKLQASKERTKFQFLQSEDHLTWYMMNKHSFQPQNQWYGESDETASSYEKLLDSNSENTRRASLSPCQCCESYWWNYDGVPERYDDKERGISAWNHPGSWFLSTTIVFGAISVLIYDFCYYVHDIDISRQGLHILSYGIFLLILLQFPAFNFLSKVMSAAFQQNLACSSWTMVFNARYITKRLQFIGFAQKGIPGKALLTACFVLPPMAAAYRGFVYFHFMGFLTTHAFISVICCGVIMFLSAVFQYVVYLTRLSFQRQFYLISKYIAIHGRDIDSCRQVLGHAIQDFNCFQQYIAIYLVYFTTIMTLGVTTVCVWQYLFKMALCEDHPDSKAQNISLHVNILCWANISISFILVIWSIGSLDVSHVIDQFRRSLITMKTSAKAVEKILEFVESSRVRPRMGVTTTMVSSLISMFVALKIGQEQSVFYFEQMPNCTSHHGGIGYSTTLQP